MKNITILAILLTFSIVTLSGCTEKGKLSEEDITGLVRQVPTVVSEEKIDGKYDASIITMRKEYKGNVETFKQIEYTKENKTIREDFGFPDIVKSLDWIKLNTPENAMIVCWWDYGHSIRGYTGRDVVIDYASRELLDTISAYKYMTPEQQKEMESKLTPHERIKDVSKIFIATDPQEAIKIMKSYSANYLFTYGNNDIRIFSIIRFVAEGTWTETGEDEINNTIVGMASKGVDINGFELVYSDENVKLYKII